MQAQTKSKAPLAFFLALLTGALIFLPFLIYDGGYFIYYGDFNVQQIPFYRLAHDAVRSGSLGWNWYTDLGVNFVGSYSFYLLFSPFFWLTIPFPNAWLPLLMAPLLVLKTACASFTAFLFLRRFVKNQNYAVLGGLLYAFSGWMSFNIFFNHFHEVAVFFPLLLLSVELLVTENRKGLFIAAVAVNAIVNYWFFVGEAVFVIIYVIIRSTDKQWGMSFRKFISIAVEAILGFGCAAVVVVPSVMALMGNPRTGAEELLTGWNAWLYWHEQRQPAILQSMFFPPELPARPNFLPDHGAKWSSLSAWLPMFAMTGVIAYFFQRKDDWLKKILALCLVFALVPGLNSLFILLNHSYYARWFYMPILLMSLATVRALEDCETSEDTFDTKAFARSIKWSAIIVLTFIIMCGITPDEKDGKWTFGLADDSLNMWIFSAITVFCLIVTAVIVLKLRHRKSFLKTATISMMVISIGFSVFYIANGKKDREDSQWIIDHAIGGWEQIQLPNSDTFSRIDIYDSTDNIGMSWHLPTIQAFHSIVPASIMEFYPEVGVTRDVGSRPEPEFFALRPLLSVRWLFIDEDNDEQEPMPGYNYYDNQNSFNIYENENFLPMGFTYDHYLTPNQLTDIEESKRSNVMLRAMVLENSAINRNLDIISALPGDGYEDFGAEAMQTDVQARRQNTADGFAFDNTGFTVSTNFDRSELLFLSVPWDEGWSATCGSENVRIEKANIGFIAVRVPPGQQILRFTYTTPGLQMGTIITAGMLLIVMGYMLIVKTGKKNTSSDADPREKIKQGKTVKLSWDEYMKLVGDREQKAADLQETISKNSAKVIENEIPETDQTLQFDDSTEDVPAEDENTTQPADSEEQGKDLT